MNTEPISLFLNPVAGRGRAGRYIRHISSFLDSLALRHVIVQSESVGNLEAKVFDAVSAGAGKILVAGGDGSIHEVVNGILRSGRPADLGVIPIGTGNDFAKACSIPVDWREAATELAVRMEKNTPARAIDAGRMNDRFFANCAGIGFDAKVNRIARDIQWRVGDFVYLAAVFKGMLDGVITPHVTIKFLDQTIEGPITLANISNGAWVGGMFHIAPMARNDDGEFDLVIAGAVSSHRIDGNLSRFPAGLTSNVARPSELQCQNRSAKAVPRRRGAKVPARWR